MKQATLCLLLKEDKVLLAMKKRGFGMGKWNGAGGKFDLEKGDKDILDAAIRETKEEIGVELKNPEKVGVFRFTFANKEEWNQDVTVFTAKEWLGDPVESEEMAPKWFPVSEIPYESMWPDDMHWLPHVLQGKKVKAEFMFGEDDKILNYMVELVEKI